MGDNDYGSYQQCNHPEVAFCLDLCVAGTSKGEDLAAALEFGSVGVLVASGIVKAALEGLVSKV